MTQQKTLTVLVITTIVTQMSEETKEETKGVLAVAEATVGCRDGKNNTSIANSLFEGN